MPKAISKETKFTLHGGPQWRFKELFEFVMTASHEGTPNDAWVNVSYREGSETTADQASLYVVFTEVPDA